jgi:hypothetical protein
VRRVGLCRLLRKGPGHRAVYRATKRGGLDEYPRSREVRH